MSEAYEPLNPFQAPNPYEGSAPPPPKAERRPGGLTTICIISIILGALGLFVALMGIGGLFIGSAMQSSFTVPATPGGSNPMEEAMIEFQEQQLALTQRFFAMKLVLFSVHFIVAILLLTGGIMTLKISATGRTILLVASGLAIVFELARMTITVVEQTKMLSILKTAFDNAGETSSAEITAFSTMMNIIIYASMAFGIAFVLVKVGYYVFSVMYLRRSHIQQLFAG